MTRRILFVTWDGPQVSYLDGLFLPIFVGLGSHGLAFDVLQFRWGDPSGEQRSRERCAELGIGYRSVSIWRRPGGLGPFASALLGGAQVRRAVRAFASDIVMPRSLMPALAVIRAGGPKLRPMIFDADGLAADERVEVSGLSPSSATYRLLRDVEAQAVRLSGSVIVRSAAAAQVLWHRAGPPVTADRFHVVANGRDAGLYGPLDPEQRRIVRAELGVAPEAPLLVYAGSIGPQYRFDRVVAFSAEVAKARPDARLLVLTGSPDEARAALSGLTQSTPIVMKVPPESVARYLAASDLGLAFRSASFAMQGVAPVKLSEYLLCGLPVVGTAGIGDTAPAEEAGVFLDSDADSTAAAQWLLEKVLPARDEYRARSRDVGLRHFSLERSVADYAHAIQALRAS